MATATGEALLAGTIGADKARATTAFLTELSGWTDEQRELVFGLIAGRFCFYCGRAIRRTDFRGCQCRNDE